MVSSDRLAALVRAKIKTSAFGYRLRTTTSSAWDAVRPGLETIGAVAGPRLTLAGEAVNTGVNAFKAASPKMKAICVAGALGVLSAVVVPIVVVDPGAGAYAATAPSLVQLHPNGIPGPQSDFSISVGQLRNAQKIIQTGQAMGLPARAWVIAVATSIQETKLVNYGYLGSANDHDSLGLFQQRPSTGWGSPEQLTDPTYAARAFYTALVHVPGWDRMNLTDAAQAVQVSAFGDRYAQWEAKAADVVNAFYGHGPLADLAYQVM